MSSKANDDVDIALEKIVDRHEKKYQQSINAGGALTSAIKGATLGALTGVGVMGAAITSVAVKVANRILKDPDIVSKLEKEFNSAGSLSKETEEMLQNLATELVEESSVSMSLLERPKALIGGAALIGTGMAVWRQSNKSQQQITRAKAELEDVKQVQQGWQRRISQENDNEIERS